MSDEPLTYADAGVDLDAAERSVELIRDAVAGAQRPEVLGSIGGFGGLFALDLTRYREPVLVSSSDGVGTKVDLARRLGRYDTIGQDLVGMVVDDLVVTGAEPLFMNDYLVVGRLDPSRVAAIVRGVADGCELAGCALVGGETAEHPGLLEPDEFDLAGFGVGIVDRDAILGPDRVSVGDAIVGLASSGVHANGFSLVRRIIEDLDLADPHGMRRPLGDVLLEPTRIYARDCLALMEALPVHALCHITGGGLPGNLPRVLPEGVGAVIDTTAWPRPDVFAFLGERGHVPDDEMWRTFNMGVGMAAIVPADRADDACDLLIDRDCPAWRIGEVTAEAGVSLG